jgi:integral membrane protein
MTPRDTTTLKLLTAIKWVAALDFLLLVPLVVAAVKDADGVVSILGPIHGAGFMVLLALCIKGWSEDRWGLWFPALVVVTLGPPGSLIGERRIRRTLAP